MAAKIYMPVVHGATSDNSTILVPKGGLPLFVGKDDEHLACGNCREVIARNTSTRSLRELFATDVRLVVECTCGCHVQMPSTVLPQE